MSRGTDGRGDPADAPCTEADERLMATLEHDESYVVERVLARGATGSTELVRAPGSAVPLVRKRMSLATSSEAAWRAAAACCARSSHLPRVVDAYELPDQRVVVREFVPGESLEDLVGRMGALPPARAAAIALDVCDAASALHGMGIVHRDLTPGNVIVGEGGATVIDLGIAREHVVEAHRDTTLLGTWGFAAPEQFGFAQTDARSDVYSIGRMLGYALTGVRPDLDGYEPALRSVPEALRNVIERASAFEPSNRYQGADELSAAIRAALGAAGGGGSAAAGGTGAVPHASGRGPAASREGAASDDHGRHGRENPGRAAEAARTPSGSEGGTYWWLVLPTWGQARAARRTATGARRVLGGVVLVVTAFFAWLFLAADVAAFQQGYPDAFIALATIALCIAFTLGDVALGWTTYCAVIRAGAYAGPGAVARYAKSLLALVVALVMVFVAGVVISLVAESIAAAVN